MQSEVDRYSRYSDNVLIYSMSLTTTRWVYVVRTHLENLHLESGGLLEVLLIQPLEFLIPPIVARALYN